MDTKTITTFKESRQALLDGYNKMKGELTALETELINLGVIPSATTPAPLVPSVPKEELSALTKKILKVVSQGKNTQAEIEKANGGKKLYGKLQSMVEQNLLTKSDTEKGKTYSIPQ